MNEPKRLSEGASGALVSSLRGERLGGDREARLRAALGIAAPVAIGLGAAAATQSAAPAAIGAKAATTMTGAAALGAKGAATIGLAKIAGAILLSGAVAAVGVKTASHVAASRTRSASPSTTAVAPSAGASSHGVAQERSLPSPLSTSEEPKSELANPDLDLDFASSTVAPAAIDVAALPSVQESASDKANETRAVRGTPRTSETATPRAAAVDRNAALAKDRGENTQHAESDSTVATAASAPKAPPPSIATEISLLDQVRTSLGKSEPKGALRTLARYRDDVSHGVLTNEADVLEIEALMMSGQRPLAREKARAFTAKHIDGALVRRVAGIVGSQ